MLRYRPFFDASHRELDACAAAFAATNPGGTQRERVAALAASGLLARSDARGIGVRRARLAYADPLTDLAYIVQELGLFPLENATGFEREIGEARTGTSIIAFALTEPGAGSDVRAVSTRADRQGEGWVLTGEKCFISNAPECDRAVVFARAGETVSAFLVDGPRTSAQAVSGHSIGRIHLDQTPARMISPKGFALAFGTLERCRPTVACAAFGMARRALDETVHHVKARVQFGAPLADLPVVRHRIAEMALGLETIGLAAANACWARDNAAPGARTGYDAAIGKVLATETAQRVIDMAVQLHGSLGVEESSVVQALYRDIRPLRIYEGATDVLMTVIASHWLESA